MEAPARDVELHDLGDEQFLDEVHSFQFWFDSVEGYLRDRPYGRDPGVVVPELPHEEADRLVTTLCNYCVGETAALDGASSLVHEAPDRNAKIFLATQVVDEARHLEVFRRRLAELGVTDPECEIERRANPALIELRGEILGLIALGDWPAAVFAQNVVLETLEYTVFRFHATNADEATRQVLAGVVADERRHSGFGENHLGRWLEAEPAGRRRLGDVRRRLDPLVTFIVDGALDDIGLEAGDRPPLAREYLDAIDRLGLTT